MTEEELFITQPTGIADVARRISGVEKSSDSLWGSEINIWGLGRDAVVLLIDGCRVNTTTDINARFGLVAPADHCTWGGRWQNLLEMQDNIHSHPISFLKNKIEQSYQ